ncbi:SRPBCC family protein [Gordonia sp. L191]|uniref:SRPBCC family protein n=1 Tax=Gordonia sp. L191 TaxID=2982699 RepID=UPI0024BF13C1|nr:SRPBCC family protein [Gordonia sp. L191]WHU45664.1 SRPBCC family protein [Gordonia sp. L191]
MTSADDRIRSASRDIQADAATVFGLIADPARQPDWDGNDNLAELVDGTRIHGVGDVFSMRLTNGQVRENRIVEFDDNRLIAWKPNEPGKPSPGHLWRWEIEPIDDASVRVTHTYDWTELDDPVRMERARATTPERLRASIDRLAALVE